MFQFQKSTGQVSRTCRMSKGNTHMVLSRMGLRTTETIRGRIFFLEMEMGVELVTSQMRGFHLMV